MDNQSPCKVYLREKNENISDDEIDTIIEMIFAADPDGGVNCKWIIDEWIKEKFKLPEDIDLVREDILEFKKLFGGRFPLPKKGYDELKIMNDEKKSKSKSKSKSIVSSSSNLSCKDYLKKLNKELNSKDLENIYNLIQDANPKKDYLVCIWIVNELKNKKIQVEDLDEVGKYLERFFEMGYQELPNFYPIYNNISNYQLVMDVVDQSVDLFQYNDKEGILLQPLTFETSCYYGKESGWCTTKNEENFDRYTKYEPLYIWFDKNKYKNIYQFNFYNHELKNKLNSDISNEEFKYFLNHPFLKDIFEGYLDYLKKDSRTNTMYNHASRFYPDWPYLKEISLDNAENAFWYAMYVLKDRFPEGEDMILKSKYGPRYALEHIKPNDWGPDIIKLILQSKDSRYIEQMYRDIRKLINSNPSLSIKYAQYLK